MRESNAHLCHFVREVEDASVDVSSLDLEPRAGFSRTRRTPLVLLGTHASGLWKIYGSSICYPFSEVAIALSVPLPGVKEYDPAQAVMVQCPTHPIVFIGTTDVDRTPISIHLDVNVEARRVPMGR